MVNPSKQKGTAMETWTVRYLAWALQDTRIDRMALHGRADIGDIQGVMFQGLPVCVECKDTQQPLFRQHWNEVETEMGNSGAVYGVLIQHRPGCNVRNMTGMALQYAIMSDDMLNKYLNALPAELERLKHIVLSYVRPLPRTKGLIWMPLKVYASLLNDGLPLGPDTGTDES